MKAIRVESQGGPEVLKLVELPTPPPGKGEALVRVEAAGVNFIDIYQRNGLYKVALPFTLGQEGAGTVEAVGPGVTEVRAGERVAWTSVLGSYATHQIVPAWRFVPVPAKLDAQTAATAGGPQKVEVARAAGAQDVIDYRAQDFEPEVKRITSGAGVHVVYDSVGKDTWERSLKSLRVRGMLVLFGQSSGPVPPIDPQMLAHGGSLFFTRPTLGHYTATREELLMRAGAVLGAVERGELKVRIEKALPLAQAAEAHRLLASRATTGKLLLVP